MNNLFLVLAGAWFAIFIVVGALIGAEKTERLIISLGIGAIGFTVLMILGAIQ